MKKITAILLAALMVLSLAACAGGGETADNIGNDDYNDRSRRWSLSLIR